MDYFFLSMYISYSFHLFINLFYFSINIIYKYIYFLVYFIYFYYLFIFILFYFFLFSGGMYIMVPYSKKRLMPCGREGLTNLKYCTFTLGSNIINIKNFLKKIKNTGTWFRVHSSTLFWSDFF